MGSLGSFPRLLEVCVEYICGRMKRDLQVNGIQREREREREGLPLFPQVSWCDRHGYRSIVSELASTHVGAAPVIKSGRSIHTLSFSDRVCGGRFSGSSSGRGGQVWGGGGRGEARSSMDTPPGHQ